MKKILKHIRKYGGACLNAKPTESAYFIKRIKLAHADALLNQPYYRSSSIGPGAMGETIPQSYLTNISKKLAEDKKQGLPETAPHFCCFSCYAIDNWDSFNNFPPNVRDVHCKHCPGLSNSTQMTKILEHKGLSDSGKY
tara:strand:- start:1791 stop:2207 length:417 start_codon:yes stop_codon:yes gene_type:complete